ncbi:hypothetical protein QAD02_008898 [Eretmocerus hayati]|uniref:Uncharacterized protein n=1 Tax=Eretmocerus hayati TaxID=131215 RepID=A0ACC2N852_9HYME|nr:hypothetical protein QAD02_008898 [Eretmocerus hayati]
MCNSAVIGLLLWAVLGSLNVVTSKPFDTRPRSLSPGSNGRIVGGEPAQIEDHPWQVSLQSRGMHFCGGSIISSTIILTAAHCAEDESASSMTVRVGSRLKDKGGSLHEVSSIRVHEKYHTNKYGVPINDLALIILAEPIVLGRGSHPVALFDKAEKTLEGAVSTLSGWGSLDEDGTSSNELYTVDIPVISVKDCSEAYDKQGGVPARQICAAYPPGGKDSCQGDSGGPLVIGNRQAGIVSWGNGCARRGYPGVYTEIAAFRDWIKKHAKV